MRLLRCEIYGFGTLCGYKAELGSGVCCIFEENGFGKTTLAAFIKAMLYGMRTARKNSGTEDSDRAKYLPWNAPAYGGSLEFEAGGREYRVIRSFDRAKAAADSFRLIDCKSGLDCEDFSENLGEELFNIDVDGFSRSTFSNGEPNFSGMPGSISKKISALVGNTAESDDGAAALKRLAALSSGLSGRSGEIATLQKKITDSRLECERLKAAGNEYERLCTLVHELEKTLCEKHAERDGYGAKLDAAALSETARVKREGFLKLRDECEALCNETESIKKKYKNGMPDEEEQKALEANIIKCDEEKMRLSVEKALLALPENREIFAAFGAGAPQDSDISDAAERLVRAGVCAQQEEKLSRELSESRLLIEKSGINPDSLPSRAELNEIKAKAERLNQIQDARGKKKTNTLLIIVSSVLLAIGLAVCPFSLAVGVAVACTSAVALISLVLLSSVRKMISGDRGNDIGQVKSFLIKYGFDGNADIKTSLDTLFACTEAFNRSREAEHTLQELGEEKSTIISSVAEFTGAYVENTGNVNNDFENLKRRLDRYYSVIIPAAERVRMIEKSIKTLTESISEAAEKIFADGIERSAESAQREMQSDLALIRDNQKRLTQKKKETEEFYLKEKIADLPQNVGEADTAEVSRCRDDCNREIDALSQKLADTRISAQRLSQSREALTEEEENLASMRETLDELSARSELLCKTAQFIKSASDALSQKYTGRVEAAFLKYSSHFISNYTSGFSVTPGLELTFERNGVGRQAALFSDGTKSVFDICMRLALTDVLFENEKPFLILDDPFAYMDEKNLSDALSLLCDAAHDRQIIYLTCHKSRIPS